MDGDPQLFGSLPGPAQHYVLTVRLPDDDEKGYIELGIKVENRREAMRLQTWSLSMEQMHTTLGFYIPLIVKATYVGTAMMRRHMWATYTQLGIAGREVTISGCGAPRRRTA